VALLAGSKAELMRGEKYLLLLPRLLARELVFDLLQQTFVFSLLPLVTVSFFLRARFF